MTRLGVLAAAVAAAALAGCGAGGSQPAPVANVDPDAVSVVDPDGIGPIDRPEVHVVAAGETLIEIALRYGMDYRKIALWNSISNPNRIEVGQQLVLAPPGNLAKVQPIKRPVKLKPVPVGTEQPRTAASSGGVTRARVDIGKQSQTSDSARVSEPLALKIDYSRASYERLLGDAGGGDEQASLTGRQRGGNSPANVRETNGITWSWPTNGKLAQSYSDSNRGIDISGARGQPVFASADGKVIYAGSGIKGYGQMVVLLHNNEFLSMYAHNDKILVAENQTISRGTQIAEMGDTGTDRVRLHFEIRRSEKTHDPLQFLPERP